MKSFYKYNIENVSNYFLNYKVKDKTIKDTTIKP